jgi:uncharacterized protein (DUF952 family)
VTPLLHITERTDWEAARLAGEYLVSTRGRTLAEEGFIHCSRPDQLRGVAEAFYAGLDDLVVLVIDPDRLTVPIHLERPAPGIDTLFPHVYGPIPVDAVVDVIPVTRDDTGRLVLPE